MHISHDIHTDVIQTYNVHLSLSGADVDQIIKDLQSFENAGGTTGSFVRRLKALRNEELPPKG